MTLRALLALHAFVTAAAGIVLAIVPAAIPAAVGIVLDPSAYLVAYFISGAEFAIAYLSLRAVTLQGEALRLAVQTIVVFHAATGLLEMYALLQGVDPRLWLNLILRIIVIILFSWFGFRRLSYA